MQLLPAVPLLGHCVGCETTAVGATQADDPLGLLWPPAQVEGQNKSLQEVLKGLGRIQNGQLC